MLKEKVAIVTGCGRGMGRAIMNECVSQGAYVYAVELNKGTLDDIKDGHVIPCYFDITDSSAILNLVKRVKAEKGRVDILINNAGIMIDAPIPMVTDEQILKTFNINVFAIMHFIQYVTRIMIRQNRGSIVNIASIMGLGGNANQMVYAASKGAVIALTKSVAKELASFGIRCNAVAPGTIATDLLKDVPEEKMRMFKSRIGLNRLGTVEEVAKAVVFLCSDNASYITGQVLGVDGMQIN